MWDFSAKFALGKDKFLLFFLNFYLIYFWFNVYF